MPWIVAGSTVLYEITSNCRPYCGCDGSLPGGREGARPSRLEPGGPDAVSAAREFVPLSRRCLRAADGRTKRRFASVRRERRCSMADGFSVDLPALESASAGINM